MRDCRNGVIDISSWSSERSARRKVPVDHRVCHFSKSRCSSLCFTTSGRSGTNYREPPTLNVQRETSKSESEELVCGFGKELCFFFVGKFYRFDELARFGFAQSKRVIGTERHTLRAEEFEQQPKRIDIVHK